MENLSFIKKDDHYESLEFHVDGDFNLHIERENGGKFLLLQKTSGNKFAVVSSDSTFIKAKVIDVDVQVLIPKTFKAVSLSNVLSASYTTKS